MHQHQSPSQEQSAEFIRFIHNGLESEDKVASSMEIKHDAWIGRAPRIKCNAEVQKRVLQCLDDGKPLERRVKQQHDYRDHCGQAGTLGELACASIDALGPEW